MSETDPSLQGIPPEEAETPPKPIRRLRGFFFDPNGGLHRGVPTWVVNEDGSETPVFREHNTEKIFPRIETPPPVDTPPEG